MRKVTGMFVVALCCVLVGCGSSAEEERAAAEASASAQAADEKAAELEAARAAQEKCEDQLGDLLSALQGIDTQLDGGTKPADFGTRLGDASVTFHRIPIRKLEEQCVLTVGVPLEDAYREYRTSKATWDACIDDSSCSLEGAKLSELQRHWAQAARLVLEADRALASPETFM